MRGTPRQLDYNTTEFESFTRRSKKKKNSSAARVVQKSWKKPQHGQLIGSLTTRDRRALLALAFFVCPLLCHA